MNWISYEDMAIYLGSLKVDKNFRPNHIIIEGEEVMVPTLEITPTEKQFRWAKIYGEWTIVEMTENGSFYTLGDERESKETHFKGFEWGEWISSKLTKEQEWQKMYGEMGHFKRYGEAVGLAWECTDIAQKIEDQIYGWAEGSEERGCFGHSRLDTDEKKEDLLLSLLRRTKSILEKVSKAGIK